MPSGEAAGGVSALGNAGVSAIPRLNVFARAHEWFWRSRSMDRLRAERPLGPERAVELLRRARVCAEVAERTLKPGEPLFNGRADAVAWELLREAIFWALRADKLISSTDAGNEAEEPDPAARSEFARLWKACDRQRLLNAAGDEGALRAIETSLVHETFADFAEHPPDRQALETDELKNFTSALLADIHSGRAELDLLRKQRLTRVGGAFFIGLLSGAVALGVQQWRERARDLAAGKPWTTSSFYGGCPSPKQQCLESQWFFFHTNLENNPWIEFDLGSVQTFASVRIINRLDCCRERTHPLVVEISNDRSSWKEVARIDQYFAEWRPEFQPVSARWVRLRSPRRTMLHLSSVRILPP